MPIWLLLGMSAAAPPTIAQAEVHVEGNVAAVHVTTDKDAIPDVLSAFETPFNLRYHTSVPLDGNVSSVYSGSLVNVISRLLGGYDYVPTIKEQSRSSFRASAANRLRPSKGR